MANKKFFNSRLEVVKINLKKKIRKFKVGLKNNITLKDVGDITLNNNEIITFKFGRKNYDFGKKNWGFYISQSINSRVKKEGFKIALVKNIYGRYYLMAVSNKKKFKDYCIKEKQKIIKWFIYD